LIQISSLKRDRVWFALALNENNKMIACSFTEEGRRKAEIAVLDSISPRARYVHISASTISTKFHELYELYMGRGRVKPSSLDLSLVSLFRRKVYSQLCRIPRGRVTTYGRIAKKLGSRRYARAVGTANGSNPMPLAIPCHRVVPSTLKVGNYGMPGRKPWEGSHVKKELLQREGVKFRDSKVSKESLWSPK
jgi:methylated-DNA-[protein]-cysteine S-methyltransferase